MTNQNFNIWWPTIGSIWILVTSPIVFQLFSFITDRRIDRSCYPHGFDRYRTSGVFHGRINFAFHRSVIGLETRIIIWPNQMHATRRIALSHASDRLHAFTLSSYGLFLFFVRSDKCLGCNFFVMKLKIDLNSWFLILFAWKTLKSSNRVDFK